MSTLKGHGDDIILEHYKKVAKNYGLSPLSSMKDPVIRNSEIHFFITTLKHLINGRDEASLSLLDVGCGNGHLLAVLRAEFPQLKLTGLEFHPDLAALASSRQLENCSVHHADMRLGFKTLGSFDFIISERSVINLLAKEEQHAALRHIAMALNPKGHYLMSESFEEPRLNVNRARKEMAMDESVNPSGHNLWLRDSDLSVLHDAGVPEIQGPVPVNYLSTHFYITRVFHPAVLPGGGRAGAGEFQNFFNAAFPPGIGNYSPILFRVFAKSK